jgi:chemotaxis protein histidine kinase CheA
MDSGKQQIIFYFIEEAKEHLETLEKGLLDLRSTLADTERVNEMFRAAHSVKGGAAMLGFDSIKTTAHRLEDCFKILQEHPIDVDRKLESLFLKGYDTLQDLVDRLQEPAGLQPDEAEKTVQAAEPNFAQLQSYLNQLASVGGNSSVAVAAPPVAAVTQVNLSAETTNILKEMLQLFKLNETPESRQQ